MIKIDFFGKKVTEHLSRNIKNKSRDINNLFGGGTEFEAKFININVKDVKQKLQNIGAKKIHKRTKMIRSAFYLCDEKAKGFARIRQEYKKTTMTVKIYNNNNFPEETEIEVNNGFDEGEKFLLALGLVKKAFQESYRTKYVVPDMPNVHEIVIDDLPGLPTYMEIDCSDEITLNKVIDMLKLDKNNMRYGPFGNTYNEYYGIEVETINTKTPFLTFKNIANEITPTKNMKLLKKIAGKQKNW